MAADVRQEQVILKHLLHNIEYARQVINLIKDEYFELRSSKLIYQTTREYLAQHNSLPVADVISVAISGSDLHEVVTDHDILMAMLYADYQKPASEWLLDMTQQWLRSRALYVAALKSIKIIEEAGQPPSPDPRKKQSLPPTAIPDLFMQALSVSIDMRIGHDYLESAEERYAFYTRVETKMASHLKTFNLITNGGYTRKTLNVFAAAPGVGKSALMCDAAAAWLKAGFNVLYVTCEMEENWIAARIDSNLMNVDMNEFKNLPAHVYSKMFEKMKSEVKGRLFIHEFPMGTATAGLHIRPLINELRTRKDFQVDILVVDYLSIMASAKYQAGKDYGPHVIIKSICEELRALCQQENIVGVSAVQLNRGGSTSSDPEMADLAECFAINNVVDLLVALITSEELEQMNQLMCKVLKNRYNAKGGKRRFNIGFNPYRMQCYDLDTPDQPATTAPAVRTDNKTTAIVTKLSSAARLAEWSFDD